MTLIIWAPHGPNTFRDDNNALGELWCCQLLICQTQIWEGRPNPAELRFGTAVRIRPNSDWERPPESGWGKKKDCKCFRMTY